MARLADMWGVSADQVSTFYSPLYLSLLSSAYDPLTNVSTDPESGRVGTWGVGDALPGPPAGPLYEGSGRLQVGQGDVLSTAEPEISVSCSRDEAVALGGRRRPRPQSRSSR
jgi:hypothetical protein